MKIHRIHSFSHLLFISLLFLFVSCRDRKEKDDLLLKQANVALMNSTNHIKVGNHVLYNSIEEKLTDRKTKEKAIVWYPKVMAVKKISQEAEDAILLFEDQLKTAAGIQVKDNRGAFDENDREAVKKADSKQLAVVFLKYKNAMGNIDPEISSLFLLTTDSFSLRFDLERFRSFSVLEALTYLNIMNSQVRNNENMVISFCHNELTPVVIDDEFPNFLITQSSTIVKPGQKLNIQAGIGIFSSYVKPVVKINGITSPLRNFSNLASGDITAPAAPGKYKIPVSCTFLDENGNPLTITREVEYEVAGP